MGLLPQVPFVVGAPVQTLYPNQKEVFSLKEDQDQWIQARVAYTFTDVDGQGVRPTTTSTRMGTHG